MIFLIKKKNNRKNEKYKASVNLVFLLIYTMSLVNGI